MATTERERKRGKRKGDIDIIMTYGPPPVPPAMGEYKLDINREGSHCGCPMLFEAMVLTKPKLHCFGHLHEG
jgi:hypothetical protein